MKMVDRQEARASDDDDGDGQDCKHSGEDEDNCSCDTLKHTSNNDYCHAPTPDTVLSTTWTCMHMLACSPMLILKQPATIKSMMMTVVDSLSLKTQLASPH
jgi:hypothetical protein